MQRSFSIVLDEDSGDDETENPIRFESASSRRKHFHADQNFEEMTAQLASQKFSLDDDDDDEEDISLQPAKIPSAGPSGRKTVLKSRLALPEKRIPISDSDHDESDLEEDKTKKPIPGEYDPQKYESLEVSSEVKEVFQYIAKYIPQNIALDHIFKPFVPEFIPAVGDIDAFLKVIPPEVGGDAETNRQLGLTVLDEPAANQSDAALLHLQLRAESINNIEGDSHVVVKKLENVEKNAKVIDKWIKDISALHKSKSSPSVRYSEEMPDLDDLMQEWSEEEENKLKKDGFPVVNDNLSEYVEEVCGLFKIPSQNKVEALHMIFELYAAVKSSQLFKNAQVEKREEDSIMVGTADQLVLE